MPGEANDLLHGALELLVLKTLSWGPKHGYAIASRLEELSDDHLQIEEGSLYPALYRLERKGLVKAEWGVSELNRRVKLYRLTQTGRQALAAETSKWNLFAGVVAKVLSTA